MTISKSKLIIPLCWIFLLIGCATGKVAPIVEPTANERLLSRFVEGGLDAEITQRGVIIYLPNLIFEFGSVDIAPIGLDKTRYAALVCNEEPIIDRKILVEGHTDSLGNAEFNMDLSRKRAMAVAEQLKVMGIAEDRLDISWFGETRPRLPNEFTDGTDNPEGRASNRRVELIIANP